MSDWKKYCLGDIVDIKHGFAFKGECFSLTPTNDILLSPGNFKIGGGFKADKFKYYNGKYPTDYILNEGDVIVTMTDLSKEGDTLGYSAKVPKSENEKYLHNQRLGLLQFKNKYFDKDFIYWLLRTKEYQLYVVNGATGTTVKHTSPTRIREYEFYAPEIKTQNRIASILSSIDDAIELNEQTNTTLDKIAQTLFSEICLPKNELPKGWSLRKLNEVVEIKYGKDHKHLEEGEIPVYGSGGIMRYANKALYESESVLIPRKGTLNNLFYINKPFWSVDTMFYTKIKNKFYGKFLFYLLKSKNLASMNVGSAVPSLTTQVLNNLEIAIPTNDILKKFDDLVSPMFENIEENIEENKTFISLRELLLPKLMKGEINFEPITA